MAHKTMSIQIDEKETEITIRRLKKKEVKPLITGAAAKADEFIALFKGDIIKELPDFLAVNIEYICGDFILPFTSLSAEQLDDMDVVDIAMLLRELLMFNHINPEKILNFFKTDAAAKQQITEALNFGGVSIPS